MCCGRARVLSSDATRWTRLDEEVRGHLELLAADYERRGTTPKQARLAARRDFGGVEPMKEIHRDQRTFSLLIDCLRDVRFGLRLLVKERWFTAVGRAGAGARDRRQQHGLRAAERIPASRLSVRRSRSYRHDRHQRGRASRPNAGISYLDLQDWSAAQRTFDGLAAAHRDDDERGRRGQVPERAIGAYISANAFDLIGHAPAVGRGFDARDDRPGARRGRHPRRRALAQPLWRRPGVIGRTIRVNGVPSTVIGVMPEGFGFPTRSRLWQPLSHLPADTRDRRDARTIEGLGRLALLPRANRRPTISDRRRRVGDRVSSDQSRRTAPGRHVSRARIFGGRLRTTFPILLTLVGFVLVIGCANVANLLLARAAYRDARDRRASQRRCESHADRPSAARREPLLASIAGVVALGLSVLVVNVFSDAMGQLGTATGRACLTGFDSIWIGVSSHS